MRLKNSLRGLMVIGLSFVIYHSALAQSDPVVMTVAGVDVPRSEFEYSFNKNNGDGVIDKKTVSEYVDLFINYKLKVRAALDARLDTMASFQEEYRMYRDQQVQPTMVTDADVAGEARKLYEQVKEQIGPRGLILPAHIFIRLSTTASQAEQDKARQRIDSVYRALKAGADFAELAKQVSDDRPTAAQGGQLPYWVGPNQTFKEFDDEAYKLQTGEMSQPFLSPAGWHVILMKGRKQLEPFDSLKAQIIQNIEQQGIRNKIATDRVNNIVSHSDGTLDKTMVMDHRADSLAAVDTEMRYLMKEYHDGLLLYEISKRQVWDKAAADEAGLTAYFKDHKKDYVWEEPHYRGMAYHTRDKQDIKAVKNRVKSLPFDQWAEALRTTFNSDSVQRIRVEIGLFKPGDNALIDRQVFKKADAPSVNSPEDYPFPAVYGKKLKRPEHYTDVRGQVVADYQDMLEKAWIFDLRRRYTFSVNQEILKTVNNHQ